MVLDRARRRRAAAPSRRARRPRAARLSRIVVVAWRRLRAQLRRRPARCGAALGNGRRARARYAGADRRAAVLGAARISARWTARTAGIAARDRPPPMCIRHELSPAHSTSAPVVATARILSASIASMCRRSSSRTCRRSRSTIRRPGSSTRSMPAHRAQQLQRPVADAQHAQRVAGRVVGDAVRVVRADVGHAEDVHEELATARTVGGPTSPPGVPGSTSRTMPAHDRTARPLRRTRRRPRRTASRVSSPRRR